MQSWPAPHVLWKFVRSGLQASPIRPAIGAAAEPDAGAGASSALPGPVPVALPLPGGGLPGEEHATVTRQATRAIRIPRTTRAEGGRDRDSRGGARSATGAAGCDTARGARTSRSYIDRQEWAGGVVV